MSRSLEWVGTVGGKRVHVYTSNVGQAFGTCAVLKSGQEVLHVTDTCGYRSSWAPKRAALRWLAQHGTVDPAVAEEYQL